MTALSLLHLKHYTSVYDPLTLENWSKFLLLSDFLYPLLMRFVLTVSHEKLSEFSILNASLRERFVIQQRASTSGQVSLACASKVLMRSLISHKVNTLHYSVFPITSKVFCFRVRGPESWVKFLLCSAFTYP